MEIVIVARRSGSTGVGQHVAQAGVDGFQRKAAGAGYLAKHGHLVATDLEECNVDLRLLNKAAALQGVGNFLFSLSHRQATQFQGSTEQCAGLAPVDPFQPRHLLGGRGCRQIADPPAFRRQIVGLPAHERLAAGRPCQHEATACGGRGGHALRE